MRWWGALALAAMLGACSGGMIPQTAQPRPPVRPAPRPAVVPPARGAPVVSPGNGAVVSPLRPRAPLVADRIAPMAVGTLPVTPVNAAAAGLSPGPAIDALGFTRQQAADALATFRISCASLTRRTDTSGLTRATDWAPICDAAVTATPSGASDFFAAWFEALQVGDGNAFATGYYEPEIDGSRERRTGYTPIYRKPDDLIEVDLGLFADDLKGKRIRGRVDGASFVPYFDRAAIDAGALDGKGLEIGWASDPVELFFLEVQGSGRMRLPDGGVMRLGYAGQNGRDYTAIGSVMRQRGLLQPGATSMQGIMTWLREHPDEGRVIMETNKSYVFFRELTGPGPLGALGVAVTGEMSAAADGKFVPLGAPVFLSLDRPEASGLWVAQDTGGAIKGPNRFDTFWGAGQRARTIAGGLAARGTAFLLLPRGTLARLQPVPASQQ